MGTANANEWNESYPANAEMVAQGAAEIRFLRTAVGQRLLKEHIAPAAANVGGEHKAGSAMIYIGDYEGDPDTNLTQRPDGATTFTVDDLGRICYDTSDDNFYILTNHDPLTWTLYPPADRSTFGAWTYSDEESDALLKDEIYKVGSDGFVVSHYTSIATMRIYSNSSSSPTTVRAQTGRPYNGPMMIMCPIRKDDYWKLTCSPGTPTIQWLPFGSGDCVIQ